MHLCKYKRRTVRSVYKNQECFYILAKNNWKIKSKNNFIYNNIQNHEIFRDKFNKTCTLKIINKTVLR